VIDDDFMIEFKYEVLTILQHVKSETALMYSLDTNNTNYKQQ